MRRLTVLPLIAVLLMGARVPVTGHIEVATPAPTYQQSIDFDWLVTGRLKGYEYPMVIVDCYQDDVLVYRSGGDHSDGGVPLSSERARSRFLAWRDPYY